MTTLHNRAGREVAQLKITRGSWWARPVGPSCPWWGPLGPAVRWSPRRRPLTLRRQKQPTTAGRLSREMPNKQWRDEKAYCLAWTLKSSPLFNILAILLSRKLHYMIWIDTFGGIYLKRLTHVQYSMFPGNSINLCRIITWSRQFLYFLILCKSNS